MNNRIQNKWNTIQLARLEEEAQLETVEWIITDNIDPATTLTYLMNSLRCMAQKQGLDKDDEFSLFERYTFNDAEIGLNGSNIRVYGDHKDIVALKEATEERLSFSKPTGCPNIFALNPDELGQ